MMEYDRRISNDRNRSNRLGLRVRVRVRVRDSGSDNRVRIIGFGQSEYESEVPEWISTDPNNRRQPCILPRQWIQQR